jgi:hypothetical protein
LIAPLNQLSGTTHVDDRRQQPQRLPGGCPGGCGRLHRIRRREYGGLGPFAALAIDRATQAMVDHATGARRGITIETWGRYLRMIVEADIILDGMYTVLYRLGSKAHWKPAVSPSRSSTRPTSRAAVGGCR